jgi:predicted nucleotidyltransferase
MKFKGHVSELVERDVSKPLKLRHNQHKHHITYLTSYTHIYTGAAMQLLGRF